MADRHDYAPSGRRGAAPTAGGNRPEEDPLVELARIVSGRGGMGDSARRRSSLTAAAAPVEADLARDLEAELLSDLQASFAAGRYDDPAPVPASYDEEPAYDAPDYEAPASGHDYAPLAFVRDDYDGGTTYSGSTYSGGALGEGEDDPARYQDQSDYNPYGRAAEDEQGYEVPVEDDGADYSGLALRGAADDEPEPDYAGTTYEDEAYAEPVAYETDDYGAPGRDEPRPYPVALQGPVAVAALPASYADHDPGEDGPAHPVPMLADYGRSDDEYGAFPVLGRGETRDDSYDDDRPVAPAYVAEEADGRRRGRVRPRREVMAIAAVLAVILVGGATALVLRGGTGGETAAPVFLAEATPTKIAPEQEAVDVAAVDPTKLIYDRVGAGEGLDPDAEGPQALLPLDDEPIADVPSLAPAANEGSREISRIILPGAPGDPALGEPLPADAAAAGEPATREFDPAAEGAAPSPGPRRVRTVVVRPDGTIVSNDARPASGEATPAATLGEAAAPALPGGLEPTRAEGEPAAGEAVAADQPRPRRNPDRTDAEAGQAAGETVIAAAEPAPAVTVRRVPVERQTVRNEPMSLLPDTPPAPVANAGAGGFIVQVASQRSEAEAILAYRGLQQRLPQLLSGRQADIQRADLGDRGTFYRVRVAPAGTRDEANRLCASLKAAGADCIVAQN